MQRLSVLLHASIFIAGCLMQFGKADERSIPSQRTFTLDVVELVAGQQANGIDNHAIEFEDFRYLFSSEKNLKKFQAQPGRYAVQLGGGCGRMGSLSGRGTTELWAVHEKQLFVFASESCREAFLAEPADFVERDDAKPDYSDESREAGQRLFRKLLAFSGGAGQVDRVQVYKQSFSEQVTVENTSYHHAIDLELNFENGSVRKSEAWNEETSVTMLAADKSYFETADGKRPMFAAGQREMQRLRNRNLISILKARQHEDFLVASLERPGTRNKVSRIAVYFDGCLISLRMNTETGQAMSLRYRARTESGAYEMTTEHLSDYRAVAEVVLPHRSSLKAASGPSRDARNYTIQIAESK